MLAGRVTVMSADEAAAGMLECGNAPIGIEQPDRFRQTSSREIDQPLHRFAYR